MTWSGKSVALASALAISGTEAIAQVPDIQTGDAAADAILNSTLDDAAQLGAMQLAESAAERLGQEFLEDVIGGIRTITNSVARLNLPVGIIQGMTPSQTSPFQGYSMTEDAFASLLLEVGIDAGAFALTQGYDLYAPGQLERFNADLRIEMLGRGMESQNIQHAAHILLREIAYFDQAAAERLRAISSAPSSDMQPSPHLVAPPTDLGVGSDGSCVATESELFQHFVAVGGVMYANSQVIAISEMPTTEVISREPFTYRVSDPSICSALE
ncbi:hypothetical protein HKCCE4037_19275 [Rhodobacterales bacterium HKCCE4037]|nr:hypothetical protein [Rhodobacterales bacterium HKCCE4037]